MTEVKRIDIKEFRNLGFLQEVNRLFFHQLGLALEVKIDNCPNCEDGAQMGGTPTAPCPEPCSTCGGDGEMAILGGIWDYRDDPEGILFDADDIDLDKAVHVAEEAQRHAEARKELLGGSTIQVIKGPFDALGMEKLT